MPPTSPTYDLIIIGAGPAGLTAAIYAVRYNLKALVIGEVIGGQMAEVSLIENYPGVPNVAGIELGRRMLDQAKALGAEFLSESVENVTRRYAPLPFSVTENVGAIHESPAIANFKIITSSKKEFLAKTLLLSAGTEPKRLEIPGEKELRGKGVSYCITCDGPLFRNKTVAVVGGGDAAFTGALELAGYASNVYLIHRREGFKAKPGFVEAVQNNPKITLIAPNTLISLTGTSKLEAATLAEAYNESTSLPLDGLFVEIGSRPSTRLTDQLGLAKDDYNFVKVGVDQSTSVPNVYAAGDITTASNSVRQITTATAEGTIAAKSIYQYLQQQISIAVRAQHAVPLPNFNPTASVNPTKCIGCGLCVTIAPKTFSLGADGKSQAKNPPGDTLDALKTAASSCPEGAITIA